LTGEYQSLVADMEKVKNVEAEKTAIAEEKKMLSQKQKV
tara:strand:- start:1294 stop:1410 length:117 start_codon:yes stop_codon:yes gene_type:complete